MSRDCVCCRGVQFILAIRIVRALHGAPFGLSFLSRRVAPFVSTLFPAGHRSLPRRHACPHRSHRSRRPPRAGPGCACARARARTQRRLGSDGKRSGSGFQRCIMSAQQSSCFHTTPSRSRTTRRGNMSAIAAFGRSCPSACDLVAISVPPTYNHSHYS